MTPSIELDEATLRKLAEAAERETKAVADWARERLAEAAEEQLHPEPSGALGHLQSYFGVIQDATFVAPPRSMACTEIDALW
ncbi:MAG: hypothetical protein KGS60_19335 [Verrucomicrobia bacterium]|nr:hypothetical protein [Verrucomicrobiota bacterium]